MLATTLLFINLLFAALTAGAMFGVWLGMNPRSLAPAVYVAQQQQTIRAMNVAMPRLGAATTLLTLLGALAAHGERARLTLFLMSASCFVVAGVITRLRNQPINAIVMTWPADTAPNGWEQLRNQWWHWHVVRTVFGVAGLCLLIAASLGSEGGT